MKTCLALVIYALILLIMWRKGRLTVLSLYDQEEQIFKRHVDQFLENKAALDKKRYTPKRSGYIPKEQREETKKERRDEDKKPAQKTAKAKKPKAAEKRTR